MSFQQAHFECYKHDWNSALIGCIYCKNAEQAADIARLREVGWAIHNTAREHGGSLTVIGTDEYIAMLDVLNGTGG
jgi:radical SAM superfamily enzyme